MQQELAQLGGGAHALATQILGNADDAADAVQDAFASVLGAPERYDAKKGPLKPWFMRVVRNRCLDMIRRRRKAGVPPDTLPADAPDAAELLDTEQRGNALKAALATLATERREIIVLRDYMDMSYADIAEVLDIAPGTVMSRLHRARLALKEALDTDES